MAKHINSSVLERMADPSVEKAYKKAGMSSLPTNIKQALDEQLAKKRAEAAASAAEEILGLYELADEQIISTVNKIRDMRSQIKAMKKQLKGIALSKAYGEESGNFLPLAKKLGCHVNVDNKSLLDIPKDWEVPEVLEIVSE